MRVDVSNFDLSCVFRAGLLLVLFLPLSLYGQYDFKVWTADDGLPQNIIRGIHQTPDGYLWIATFDGLARFDGMRFTVFNTGNTPGMTSNRLGKMYGAPNGDLWLNTEDAEVIRYSNGRFEPYGAGQGISGKVGLTGDDAGHIWVLSSDLVFQWNENLRTFVNITPPNLKAKFHGLVWDNSGYWEQDETTFHLFTDGHFLTYTLPREFAHTVVDYAAQEKNGTIWLITSDKRQFRLNGKTVVQTAGPGGMSTTTYTDTMGKVWTIRIGERLDRSLEYEASGKTQRLEFNSIYEERERNLWSGKQ